MEKQILQAAKDGIAKAIEEELVGYNKPLSNITSKVIDARSNELFTLIDGEFSSLLSSKKFKSNIKDALNQKLARVLINKLGGDLESKVNELKQNPETRAKITLAISQIVEESLAPVE